MVTISVGTVGNMDKSVTVESPCVPRVGEWVDVEFDNRHILGKVSRVRHLFSMFDNVWRDTVIVVLDDGR